MYLAVKKYKKECEEKNIEQQYIKHGDRFFNKARLKGESGMDISDDLSKMCDIMMTRDTKMRKMVKKHFYGKRVLWLIMELDLL